MDTREDDLADSCGRIEAFSDGVFAIAITVRYHAPAVVAARGTATTS